MLFEGEYLDDKRYIGIESDENDNIKYKLNNNIYGKGKEYDDDSGRLIFESEYINGKKNGKGKEYDYSGRLGFECEYLDDKKWNGKCYDSFNNILYELKQGKGSIKEYNRYGKLRFEGEYLMEKKMEKEKNMITMVN